MSFGVKLGALAWARDNAHACHLISRGEANLYTSPPVEIAVTPRLLGRGRLPLEFIRGHLGVRQQPMWGEAGLLSCTRERAPECRVSRVLLVMMRLPPSENRDSPPATSSPLPALSTYFTSKAYSARGSRPWLLRPPGGARGASRGANFMKFERCGPELWSGRGPRGGKRAF